jgi:hypothetical protein
MTTKGGEMKIFREAIKENWLGLFILAMVVGGAIIIGCVNGVNTPCPKCGYRATLWGK